MTPNQLRKVLRDGAQFSREHVFICDAGSNRGKWVTTGAFAFRNTIQTADLWAKYNLSPEVGHSYQVNGTVTHGDTDTPNLAYIIDSRSPVQHEAAQGEYQGRPCTVGRLVPIESGGIATYLNVDFYNLLVESGVNRWTMSDTAGHPDPNKVVSGYLHDVLIAIIMPVRT